MRLLSPSFLLLILLIGTPILEIAIFIQLGGWIGIGPTLLTIVATAVIGTILIRRNWLQVMARASQEAEAGRAPVREVFQAICLLMAGLLLLTPGFATDAAGFLLLVPPVQLAIGAAFAHRITGWMQTRSSWGGFAQSPFSTGPFSSGPFPGGDGRPGDADRAGPSAARPGHRPGRKPGNPGVIDAAFEVVGDPDDQAHDGPAGDRHQTPDQNQDRGDDEDRHAGEKIQPTEPHADPAPDSPNGSRWGRRDG